ncbi:MAG TPA: maltose alpha-D-glucosyltransferase [Candidatus Polarisedimenticolia bacterium]|nr:maltose alpha-D-glucosyltransferase [Candidatus Polarisedimenticolia bacterium]
MKRLALDTRLAGRPEPRKAGRRETLWYKDAVIYQVHVRAFADSGTDGSGDFRGLAGKLDYLRDLGVSALWLLPFYPSPFKDDGYDISDYTDVHPDFGTLADFRHLLKEAHRRGLRVITELVLNHTSDQHGWFQRARRAPAGSAWRDFYVWSDTPDRYSEARVIFRDFESSNWSWDPVARAYYWHRFYAHQPDLNWDHPAVRKSMLQVLDFWLGMGVDGLRLDAVPYLFEREGTNCENLPETHAMLKELRAHVDARHPDRLLLAEANQWPEDAVAYFGGGSECHMAFHFPVMPRLFMSVRMEERYPILDILEQTPDIPDNCQWALFLRNHDELTLEMVTDEERDYMYRVYAHDPRARINFGIRRRLAPLLGNDRRRIELMNGLLLSLPGTPVLYYGDEIGMGDNIWLGDRNGVRTPMQWSSDRNAGFSRANSQRLYLPVTIDPDFHYESLNVEVQQNNPSSLLWWMRRTIAVRKRFRAFGRGTLEFLQPDNRKVLAFLRRHHQETLLVVANLSRHAQFAELDLRAFEGTVPLELFGQTPFPPIGALPYLLTLAPHAFLWFYLEPPGPSGTEASEPELPELAVTGDWSAVTQAPEVEKLEALLPGYLRSRRWFGGKARRLQSVRVADAVMLGNGSPRSCLLVIEVEYTEGEPERYLSTLAWSQGAPADARAAEAIARLSCGRGEGILHSALVERDACTALLEAIPRRRRLKGRAGEVAARPTRAFRRLAGPQPASLEPALLRAEQSNSTVQFSDRLILKLFRRMQDGINPELEVGLFLTERAAFPHAAPVAGWLEYRTPGGAASTLAIVQGFVPNEGDAWSYTLDVLGRYFERAAARGNGRPGPGGQPGAAGLVELARRRPPETARDRIGIYLESARLLGRRTAELHLALASHPSDPAFAPEPFSLLYQRSLYQAMRDQAGQALDLLARREGSLHAGARAAAHDVLGKRDELFGRFAALRSRRFDALRLRVHGDYHLGQVLFTGKDFVIIDFEGEPARPASARRIKRSPLRDVAGMLRSFHYAAWTSLAAHRRGGMFLPEDSSLEPAAWFWVDWVSAAFLRSYLATASRGGFLPSHPADLAVLLEAFLMEKAVYEIAYELNNRPAWAGIPLRGLQHALRAAA